MTEKLLPQVPVMTDYEVTKAEITARIAALNSITELTEDNKKEVKNGIAQINKVKDKVARYRIDNTNAFLQYIQPYIDQCKEIEKLCDTGLSDIKLKVGTLEAEEKAQKTETVRKLYNFFMESCAYRTLLKFEMFFEPSMANKTSSLTVIETQLNEWIKARTSDIDFIKKQSDDPEAVIAIYLNNGLKLTAAIEKYQEQFKSQAEIQAIMATEYKPVDVGFEKRIDITLKIKQLPQSKVAALQSFLDGLGVEWEVSK